MGYQCMYEDGQEGAVLVTNLQEGETQAVCGQHVHDFFQALADSTRPVPYELTDEGIEAAATAAAESDVITDEELVAQTAPAVLGVYADDDPDLPDALRFDSARDQEARVGEPPKKAARPRKPKAV